MIVTSCYHKSKGKTARMEKNRVFEVQDEFMHTKKIIFAELFILQNKIQTKFDKWIGEISSKQFLILIIVAAFPMPPSLTEVALRAGCSRQNIKKVAAVLEKKGFISLSGEQGSRAVRIVLQQKFFDFYDSFIEKAELGLNRLFSTVSSSEASSFLDSLKKIKENVEKMQVE